MKKQTLAMNLPLDTLRATLYCQANSNGLKKNMDCVYLNSASWIMNSAGKKKPAFTIDDDGSIVMSDLIGTRQQ